MKTVLTGIVLGCLVGFIAAAETGMGLIVASTGQFEKEGSIRRIDVSNGAVINTTGAIGTGMYPRFAPDGNSFAFLSGTNVTVADLNGNVIRSFPVGGSSANSKLSFTTNGIYIAGAGQIRLYDPTTGTLKSQKAQANGFTGSAYVSRNGTMASSTESVGYASGSWGVSFHNLTTGATAKGPLGCSACPSPSGALGTNNLWETGKEHRTMYILNSSNGSVAEHLDIGEILGLGSNYCWNTQCWSGNSEQIIILPVGGWGNQITNFCEPWIYNRITGEAIQLANRSSSSDFWQPYDFYQGKLPPAPGMTLSPASLQFTAVQGGANPTSQSVTVSATGGLALTSLTVTKNAAWLTVVASGTGATRTLANSVTVGSLAANAYSGTVTLVAGSVTKTYGVTLTVTPKSGISNASLSAASPRLSVAGGNRDRIIRWTAQRPGNYSLTVYGLQGETIWKHMEPNLLPGPYSVNWKPNNASGRYLLLLESPDAKTPLLMKLK